ncbi:hypothetical protein DPMN_014295 [Dreissena polymorpha]|uniref:Uncharacterized protein n=1 Tax=Dreissena polymorpha TaxID=45954 RepID=A0A9D4S531_DREPO|nr:hypothetical protein DPMN_014295 [Dreissena polymorpha]
MSLEVTSIDITKKVCVICGEQDDRQVSKLGEKECQGLSLAAKNYKGCDTTSRIYGIGKGVVLKKALNDSNFKNQAKVFMNTSSHSTI